ncbi:MAG: T9SS type A sorting domain-containing protein [Candidatus Marinimicrobia bacterium]|nr:T9SS type A sorting domain-containing protein [Candidatus Neomarinimicrobiota bacterium]
MAYIRIIGLMFIFSYANGQSWELLNAGNVNVIEYHPDSTDLMYLGSSNTFLKSYDFGETYDTLGSIQNAMISIHDIEFHPSVPDTILIADGSWFGGGNIWKVFQNEDAEYEWEYIGIGTPEEGVSSVQYLPWDEATLFATTTGAFGNRLMMSVDYGENWLQVSNFPEGQVIYLEIDHQNIGTMYLGVFSQGLFKSTDSGASWTEIQIGGLNYPSILLINPLNGSTLYASGNGAGLYKSMDSGENWMLIGEAGPFTHINTLQMAEQDTSMLMVSSTGELFRVSFDGQSWENISFNLSEYLSTISYIWSSPNLRYKFVADIFSNPLLRLDLSTVGFNFEESMIPKNAIIDAFPNPFNDEIKISYLIPESVDHLVSIYDIQGELMFSEFVDYLGGFTNSFSWNAQDETGIQLSSGVYIVRVSTLSSSVSQKIVLLR